MFEQWIAEIKMWIRQQIDSATKDIRSQIKKFMIVMLLGMFIFLPLWFIGIYYLVATVFFYLLKASQLISPTFYTGILTIMVAIVVMFIILAVADRK